MSATPISSNIAMYNHGSSLSSEPGGTQMLKTQDLLISNKSIQQDWCEYIWVIFYLTTY